ncbi:hypothetical protein GPROT1_03643 [Gammaproteobacteria bacterium]|nr:hypothetical protein GPROT1_03643 [Gammaproteobacteria bacterium]
MILDLPRFVASARPRWTELESLLASVEAGPDAERDVAFLARLHLLYERTAADLGKVRTFASEPELVRHLEALVARAYAEVHETRDRRSRLSLRRLAGLVLRDAPRAVRRHPRSLLLATLLTLAGMAFGALALDVDPAAKRSLVPFEHLSGDPAERVRREEGGGSRDADGHRAAFSSALVTHNVRVAVLAFALGGTAGAGTAVLLFHNGVVLGAVGLDYVRAGQTTFLLGWLLPHGTVEIPAFLLAGQAGLVLGASLLGRGSRWPLPARLRGVLPDLVAILALVVALLSWAAIVESFLSQHHEPALPYGLKIGFGLLEGILLAVFLLRAGRDRETP